MSTPTRTPNFRINVIQITPEIEIQYTRHGSADDVIEVTVDVINGTPVTDFIYDDESWDSYQEMVKDVTDYVLRRSSAYVNNEMPLYDEF